VIQLREDLVRQFPASGAFDAVMALEGEVFRSLDGRRTLRFERGGKSYFAKLHSGAGWKEIVKNLCRLRLPILGAWNEKRAIERLHALGVETMTIAGYGRRGWIPSRLQSFIITDELRNTLSLEDFCRPWRQQPPSFRLKKTLIDRLAWMARTLHRNGVNHRDFYICHFLMRVDSEGRPVNPDNPHIHLIDLHRVQLRRRTPRRWIVKDLASLYFSSLDLGLTSRDVLRFVRAYRGESLRQVLKQESRFWRQVIRRAVRLYRRDFRRTPILPIACPED
jgi:heptose I phosphotransferase